MEEILELVLTVFEALFDGIKKPKARRWALTGFWSVTFMFLAGICFSGHMDAIKDENHTGTIIMGILTALVLIIVPVGYALWLGRNGREAA